jgi:Tfp pilus assembly protein PilN
MRIPWERVMNELRKVLPTDVWLIHIEAKGDGTLTFNGFGLSYESVARFMVSLNASPVFQNADVVIAQKQGLGKMVVINFSATVQLAPPGKAAALP